VLTPEKPFDGSGAKVSNASHSMHLTSLPLDVRGRQVMDGGALGSTLSPSPGGGFAPKIGFTTDFL
jgi:hypothetical protein